jgi:phosphatidate cytidylyltransferase
VLTGVLATAPYVAGALAIGGIAAAVSRQRELIRRWATWAVSAPIVGGALLFGSPGAAVLAAVLAVVATAEYGRLVRLPIPDRYAIGTGVVGVIVTAAFAPAHVLGALAIGAAAVLLVPLLAGDPDDGAGRAAYGLLGFCWLSALAGLVALHGMAMPLIVAVSIADVAAWGAGRAIPSPRLSPMSPAKGWSGTIVGAATGIGVLALLGAVTSVTALTPATIIAVALGAPIGDLFESMLKRGAGVKDAGSWLPGFGGLLDRIDSLLITLAVAVLASLA